MPKKRVLIAEDDHTMVSLLKTLLNMEGYEVSAIEIHQDVVETVKKQKPDILLLDVYLFDQNGLEIVDQLRQTQETKSLRILMSSGANVREECLNRGADGFIMKPYMPNDLISTLKKVSA